MNEVRILISACLKDSECMEKYGSLVTDFLYMQARREQLENECRGRVASAPSRKWGYVFSLWNLRRAGLFSKVFQKEAPRQQRPAQTRQQAPARTQPSPSSQGGGSVFNVPSQNQSAPAQAQAPAQTQPAQTQAPAQTQPTQAQPAQTQTPDQEPQKSEGGSKDPEERKKEQEQKIYDILQEYQSTLDGDRRRALTNKLKGYANTPELKQYLGKMDQYFNKIKSSSKFDRETGRISQSGVSIDTLKDNPKAYIFVVLTYYLVPLAKAIVQAIKSGDYLEAQQEQAAESRGEKPLSDEEKAKKQEEDARAKEEENVNSFVDNYLDMYGDGLSPKTLAKIKGYNPEMKKKLMNSILGKSKKKKKRESDAAGNQSLYDAQAQVYY